MNRETAIDLLDNLLGMVEDNHGSDYDKAIHMGIDALKMQLSGEDATKDATFDYIDRKAAIEAAIEAADIWDGGYNYERGLCITEGLQRVPSAQPQQVAVKLNESCTDCPLYDNDAHNCPRFNKVIPRVLDEQQVTGKLPSVQPNLQQTCNQLATDCIDRKAAIDAFEERLKTNGYSNVALVSELNRCIGYLMQLPSVQPQSKREWYQKGYEAGQKSVQPQRWIPVTEALPEDGLYLVTTSKGQVQAHVFSHNGNSEEYWMRCNRAWMPFPEPWRGGQDE